ncbi:MAG: hypothetical protein H8D23_40940 [Candidatus Brocadiales bacterium]|nr:hypothetical protein [Candidatus Brocadiales bacterium]
MAKRFTDTNKWDKVWFRKLSPTHKAFWEYVRDRCSNAGVWDVDFETAEYYIKGELDIEQTREIFKDQYIEAKNGMLWFMSDFIDFQYGELSESCSPHKSVINQLKKLNLLEGYLKGSEALKDKDKDKEKDKRGIAKGEGFEVFWQAYPNKKSKGQAQKEWKRLKPDEQLLAKMLATIEQAKTSAQWTSDNGDFIPKPSTWLESRGWEDEYSQATGNKLALIEEIEQEIIRERG